LANDLKEMQNLMWRKRGNCVHAIENEQFDYLGNPKKGRMKVNLK
jgi:hypothetical protein